MLPMITAALFITAKTQKQPSCLGGGLDKEDVVYTHT